MIGCVVWADGSWAARAERLMAEARRDESGILESAEMIHESLRSGGPPLVQGLVEVSAAGDLWFSIPYHAFNLFEGACWIVVGALVIRRYIAFRRSRLEVVYALAFLSFGATDFREAYVLESWLVWAKLANLIALIGLRAVAIRCWYPGSKLF
jgi:hypothetical protein